MRPTLVIIGGGPAGLSAALNAQLEGWEAVVISQDIGGRAAMSARIDNVVGWHGVSGPTFANDLYLHAKERGVKFLRQHTVKCIDSLSPGLMVVRGEWEGGIEAQAILLATGMQWNPIDTPGMEDVVTKGLATYGCPSSDFNVKGKVIGVVGGANSAGINALDYVQRGAFQVVLFARSGLGKMSHYLEEQVRGEEKILLAPFEPIERVWGMDDGAVGVRVANLTYYSQHLFLFPDASPRCDFVPGLEQDPNGFVRADARMMTNLPGIFVAGDVRKGSVKRIASAIGDGASVVFHINQWWKERKEK